MRAIKWRAGPSLPCIELTDKADAADAGGLPSAVAGGPSVSAPSPPSGMLLLLPYPPAVGVRPVACLQKRVSPSATAAQLDTTFTGLSTLHSGTHLP